MLNFSELTDADKERLMSGAYGRALAEQYIQPCVAALYWIRKADSNGHWWLNGSAFFIETGERLFGVTAAHVFDNFKIDADADASTVGRLDNVPIDLRARLICRAKNHDRRRSSF